MGITSFWKDILFPARCARCRRIIAEGAVCEKCYLEIEPYNFLRCGECRARLPSTALAKEGLPADRVDSACHPKWPFILGAATNYKDESAQSLIKALKFEGISDAAKPLAELIFQFTGTLPLDIFENSILVPIPLRPARLRERGYNQSELIANILGEKMNLPIKKHILIRTKLTKPQSEARSHEEREINVSNCFSLKNPAEISGRKIVLIDDVITSGHTLYQAAQTLRAGGAGKIIALTVAMA